MNKSFLTIVLTLFVAVTFTACTSNDMPQGGEPTEVVTVSDEQRFDEATNLIESGQYEKAYEILKEIEVYPEAEEELKRFSVTEKECLTSSEGTYITEIVTDGLGNVLKEEWLDYDNSLIVCEYVWEDGVETGKRVDNDGYVTNWTYTYDENGHLISMDGIDNEVNKGKYEYEYDLNGNLVKETYSDAAGVETTDFTYDEKFNIVKEEKNGTFGWYYTVENFYDEQGQNIKMIWTDSSGSWVSESTFENGVKIKNTITEDGAVEVTEHTYYPEGKVKTSTTRGKDGTETVTEYTYETKITYNGI